MARPEIEKKLAEQYKKLSKDKGDNNKPSDEQKTPATKKTKKLIEDVELYNPRPLENEESIQAIYDRNLQRLNRLIEKLTSGLVSESAARMLDKHLTNQPLIAYINGGEGDPLLDKDFKPMKEKKMKEPQAR